jgi:hypothetical protein
VCRADGDHRRCFTFIASSFMLGFSALAGWYGRILPSHKQDYLGSWVRSLLFVPPM